MPVGREGVRASREMRAARVGMLVIAWMLIGGVRISEAETVRSSNFLVQAPTLEMARQVARRAEECRRESAIEWLGRELPNWDKPCRVKVKLTKGEAGGITSFAFGRNRVVGQDMTVEGRLERIMNASLPHEVTHTVLAHYFGGPIPRWADEGACLCSEDSLERGRHDQIARHLLLHDRAMPLKQLFVQDNYPKNIMDFYGQGYSISKFLIEIGGRPRFLRFLKDGMNQGWEKATVTHYELPSVRELDRAWRAWHKVNDPALAQQRLELPAEPSARTRNQRVARGQSSGVVRRCAPGFGRILISKASFRKTGFAGAKDYKTITKGV